MANEMKHWKCTPLSGKTLMVDREITLKEGDRVLNLGVEGELIYFTEACDEWFSVAYTHEEAIELLKEAIAWIESK